MKYFVVFCLVYFVYYFTLYPSVPGGDSGELLAEACQLGVAHPPGYPTFTLLAHFSMKVPIPRFYYDKNWHFHYDPRPTKAWYVNHLSGVFGAFTAVFMLASLESILLTKLSSSSFLRISSLPVFFFAFSPLIWEYSVTAEVFALNNLLCSIILYLTITTIKSCLLLQRKENPELQLSSIHCSVLVGSFLCGLILTNQHTSLLLISFLILTLLLYLWFSLASSSFWPLVSKAAVSFIVGLSPYVYLYWSSRQSPEGSWGDCSQMQGLIRHILRAEYGTFRLGGIEGSENWAERILLYLKFVSNDNYSLIFPIVCIGLSIIFLSSWINEDSYNRKSKGKGTSSLIPPVKTTKSMNKKAIKQQNVVEEKKNEEKNLENTEKTDVVQFENDHKNRKWILVHLTGILFVCWLFYLFIWHCIFSNLPLHAPMPYAIHSRFWMQPNILLYVIYGIALEEIICFFRYYHFFNRFLLLGVESIFVILIIAMIISQRYPLNNRSELGWILHKYGEASLHELPDSSLLLSHTDIDLNTIRYLRVCEGYRASSTLPPVVQQFSTQMMPYPWFSQKQSSYFYNFTLPDLSFPEISTNRVSEGNKKFITRLLRSNLPELSKETTINNKKQKKKSSSNNSNHGNMKYVGGIYLDMQAINDQEIGDRNEWLGEFSLIPWGSQYRVFSLLNLSQIEEYHVASYQHLQSFHSILMFHSDVNTPIFHRLFPLGSWESAVFNIYNDLHNQYGLSLLTYVISLQSQKDLTIEHMPILLDRLFIALELLQVAHTNVHSYGTLSSSPKDLWKNTALAYLRFHGLLMVFQQFREKVVMVIANQRKSRQIPFIKESNFDKYLFGENIFPKNLEQTREFLQSFLENHPQDKDYMTFAGVVTKIENTLRGK